MLFFYKIKIHFAISKHCWKDGVIVQIMKFGMECNAEIFSVVLLK